MIRYRKIRESFAPRYKKSLKEGVSLNAGELQFHPISEKEFEDTGCTPSFYPGEYYATDRIKCDWGMEYDFTIADCTEDDQVGLCYLIVDVYGPAVCHAFAEFGERTLEDALDVADSLWKDLSAGNEIEDIETAEDFEENQLEKIFLRHGAELQYP